MREAERERKLQLCFSLKRQTVVDFSRDLGRMPGEFLSGRLLAFQVITFQRVCVAVVTCGQLSSIGCYTFLLNFA